MNAKQLIHDLIAAFAERLGMDASEEQTLRQQLADMTSKEQSGEQANAALQQQIASAPEVPPDVAATIQAATQTLQQGGTPDPDTGQPQQPASPTAPSADTAPATPAASAAPSSAGPASPDTSGNAPTDPTAATAAPSPDGAAPASAGTDSASAGTTAPAVTSP
ncbi:MAG: hypothetical protein JO250_09200 [Armatimonadetes bacterium]|nr:hypothetical protein [Armatimonadota bacterium]